MESQRPDMIEPPELPVRMKFMRVDAGEFLMGSTREQVDALIKEFKNDWYKNELPQHTVHLDEYYMGKYPVTNAQYAIFAMAAGKAFKFPDGKAEHPVVNVSWHDAVNFCKWLSGKSKHDLALPTEAQWEKAARGVDGRIYPWGNQPPNKDLCNFGMNIGDTTPVGKYSPQGDSPYGCADMAGNVWEWCADGYVADAYAKRNDKMSHNPITPENDDFHVMRGGSYFLDLRGVRCAYRGWNSFDFFFLDFTGFRVVLRSHLNTSVL